MKDVAFFALGLAAGVLLGIAMTFFALGSVIRIKIDLPSEYKVEGIPSDFTIRGGLAGPQFEPAPGHPGHFVPLPLKP